LNLSDLSCFQLSLKSLVGFQPGQLVWGSLHQIDDSIRLDWCLLRVELKLAAEWTFDYVFLLNFLINSIKLKLRKMSRRYCAVRLLTAKHCCRNSAYKLAIWVCDWRCTCCNKRNTSSNVWDADRIR
jgi:hypothetical protein